MKLVRRFRLVSRWSIPILLLVLLVAMGWNLTIGSADIPPAAIARILLGQDTESASWQTIVFQFRLPETLTATLAGASLAVSGLQMQTLFRNPLAGPFVLGINAGASLGVALVVLLAGRTASQWGWLGNLGSVVAASVGASLVLSLAIAVAQWIRSSTTLLLLGLMFGYITNAAVTILLHFSPTEQVQAYLTWTFGSFGGVSWLQMRVFLPVVLVSLLGAHLLSKILNLLLLGEQRAQGLGVSVKVARFWVVANASLLAGVTTAFCGPIAFLGIAVPHLSRAWLQTLDRRVLLPATALLGGILALVASAIASLPGSQTILPLNSVTALIGAPVVVWTIISQRRGKGEF
ncbi:iron ABC transporter permease [Geitlerinema sp. PCC 9228]|jgi:iron complex transport system permease protein|uniref:FecCD family ABC transporter permease n=1 Tax=Geitlerinema sp. PCC 9228 TaxID=111611 RepID=UPI0008F9C136|nr:iron ABC transporter permease [Geitlerinema sp. PCC 9228]